MSPLGLPQFWPQLTVQTAGFVVTLGPAGAALVDSLVLHPVHLLVNRVVPGPLGKGSLREQSQLLLHSLPPHQQHTALICHLYETFLQPLPQVLVKNEANTANCILVTSNSPYMLCAHIILKNLYSAQSKVSNFFFFLQSILGLAVGGVRSPISSKHVTEIERSSIFQSQ